MEIKLREYQVEAIQGLRQGVRDGHRSQMLVAPTGSGKTVIAASLMKQSIAKGSKTAFVVDRINLVDQTSKVLDDYGIPHGVIQAGHWRYRPNETLQVCSAQTLEARGFFPDLKYLIPDECHVVRRQTADLIQNRPNMVVTGLTATPFTKGLSELYTNLVNVTTVRKLQKEGFLSDMVVYAAKAIDMTGAKVVAGEWAEKEIEQRGMQIVGDIVKEWVDKTTQHYGGPVKTIVFSATVDHGAELCKEFQAAGFNFQQISYKDTSDEDRRNLIEEFRRENSSVMGLVSCEVLSRGFDVPDVMCGISARPYRKSLSSHIQQIGRVLRPSPGKKYSLWLCHSGNYLRFHSDTEEVFERGVSGLIDKALDSKTRKEPEEGEKAQLKCIGCGMVLPPMADRCPGCGRERVRRSMIETVAGEMVLIGSRMVEATGKYAFLADKDAVWRQLTQIAVRTRSGDLAQRWAQAKFKSIYGRFYHKQVRDTVPMRPSEELVAKITSDNIRFAKRRRF